MRRTAPVLLATLFVLGLLANFHTSPGRTVPSTPGGASSTSPTTTDNPAAGASPGSGDGSGSTGASTTVPPAGSRAVDGPAEVNRYGTVQVRVTLSGSRIVDVQALQLPSDRSRSLQISNFAGPTLRQEALQAQGAQIDTVSGATYTSKGYRQSLQAAIDQAGRG